MFRQSRGVTMKRTVQRQLGFLVASVWACIAAGAAEMPAAAWFTNHTAETFRKLPAAQQNILPDKLDRDLLDAAVFHETNRRRAQHQWPPLKFAARARAAARMQSRAMAEHGFVGHENVFEAGSKTMMDRARLAGLAPGFLAENVASSFGRQYESGKSFYVRTENGRKVFSLTPKGAPIPMRSYVEFADALLDGWMNSPGHRKNILHQSPEILGIACEPAREKEEMEKFYCTQVFFTPLR